MPRNYNVDGFFRDLPKKATTAQDKTDAAVRLIRDDDAEKRAELTASLRAARMERDADESAAAEAPRGKKPRR
ncbi:hypothetical protein B6V75_07955 [Thioclava sp. F1Mire-8]|uniref:hypothetical protein n=1 Tax=Thioclava sp. F1Mire-8 TaxID=1973006 RepID=UPI000B54184E|nr:hypothetical protein [Thioclava sp. F1Mire-8]OWY06018.1 hypothetical protein B6V75_07955 [Thioclava sp. F1Mire-8]